MGSGTLNLTALLPSSNGAAGSELVPASGELTITGSANAIPGYSGLIGPTSFGSGSFSFPFPGTYGGDPVSIFGKGQELFVFGGYISGQPLANAMTFRNATFSSLGFTPGTYTYTWGVGPTADSLSVTTVPEPRPTALMAIGSLAAFLLYRLRHMLARVSRQLVGILP